jgi:hypothetical protein
MPLLSGQLALIVKTGPRDSIMIHSLLMLLMLLLLNYGYFMLRACWLIYTDPVCRRILRRKRAFKRIMREAVARWRADPV